ncbi:Retrovirus-related Pol polyprotein from transposon TNT 1-94 [Gossypium australe]|uniref:Retrovirus-related Pol polyprotein from transposon TNT 1-94 n=1 Tax=Gossypium australe TaxID=47621 RepID=A0A5B6V612_9ROSI|nr:Retrovirus-related Pol polyprotein from transposon TNT 1-94 [Gossypium australe]
MHPNALQRRCCNSEAICGKNRIYDFLAGLNIEFDVVRVQILGKSDLPSLNEAISIIRAEEGCWSVMLEPQGEMLPERAQPNHSIEIIYSAHIARGIVTPRRDVGNFMKGPMKSQIKVQAYIVSTSSTSEENLEKSAPEFNIEEIEKLKTFLGSFEKPTSTTGQGDIYINKDLTLRNVLHFPKLFANLISIQKLSTNSNCSVTFFPSHYVF